MLEMMTLQQAMRFLENARLVDPLGNGGATAFLRVHTDTRTIEPGDLFVALRGENFDAHTFVAEAAGEPAMRRPPAHSAIVAKFVASISVL